MFHRQSEELIVARRIGTTQPYLRRRGSALTGVSGKKKRDRRLDNNLTTTDKVQELQRKLYLKAKSQSNFRFYALYDKIYRMDALRCAWQKVRANHGSPGIDGKTIKDIEDEGVDDFLERLQEKLRAKEYRPSPVRRVYIPKPDGRLRPLSIPTVKDRVVQMALKLVIEPVFEADFEDNSYGYRPGKSAQQAVKEVTKYLNYGLIKVIDADIENCFGSIPHKQLLEMIARRIVDGKVLHLIKLFLEVGVMEQTGIRINDTGTPQGGVISPLLANIYLDRIDKGWKPLNKFAPLIRYADDLVILTKYRADKALYYLQQLTTRWNLKLNLNKTRLIDAEKESFDFLGFSFKKTLNRKKTKRVAYFWPSKKAENSIREKIKKITNPHRPVKVEKIIEELNPVLRGWVNYFKIANSSKKFGKIRLYTANKVRKFIRRRKNKSGYGYKWYSDGYLYNGLGLHRDYRLSWTKALR
ncbi:group II intron reverse transcriptase/maturase [Candidatus Aerophobetes bacterium]|nr:group II intron reverse transcriptase/maturase [Candidatus Aerophobetes bacterium]